MSTELGERICTVPSAGRRRGTPLYPKFILAEAESIFSLDDMAIMSLSKSFYVFSSSLLVNGIIGQLAEDCRASFEGLLVNELGAFTEAFDLEETHEVG